ncbi:unnamed protein product [Brachionus calyciflorus]|uniref:Uncharacterized protein n=1 Tax=Brachionus calyciflorus TaxID=104777 RepID=A0A813X2W4_9BILA|nr:unnamed protein product [Brachionus calyciflorus]
MIQINEKRSSSDSNEFEEQKQGAFSSIKTFILSKSRKPENINDNDIIINSNDQKLLIKVQESPKKPTLNLIETNIEESFNISSISEVSELHPVDKLRFYYKIITSIKDGLMYRTSTPSGERSFVEELQNIKEMPLTTDQIFISSKLAPNIEKIENKIGDTEELIQNFDLLILEKDTKIRFYENDSNKLQGEIERLRKSLSDEIDINNSSDNRFQKMEEEIKSLKNTIVEKETEISNLSHQNPLRNEQKIKKLELEIHSAHEEKKNIEIVNASLLAEKINNETIIKSLKDEIQHTGIENSKTIDSLQQEINRLQDEKRIQGIMLSAEENNSSLKIVLLLQEIKKLTDQNNYIKNCENKNIEKIQSLEKLLADSKNLSDLDADKKLKEEYDAILQKKDTNKFGNFESSCLNYRNLILDLKEEIQKKKDPIIGVRDGPGVANGRFVYLGNRGKPYFLTPGLNKTYVTDRVQFIKFFEY